MQAARGIIAARPDMIEKQLQGREYLTGNQFGVADAYLITMDSKIKSIGTRPRVALVLQGGGALGAYQAASIRRCMSTD